MGLKCNIDYCLVMLMMKSNYLHYAIKSNFILANKFNLVNILSENFKITYILFIDEFKVRCYLLLLRWLLGYYN